MISLKKLKAGSLQLVTFVVVVIALLLGCFILLVHTHKKYRVKTYLLKDTTQNADKGILYALEHNNIGKDSLEIITDGNATIKLKTELWGTYQKVGVVSKLKNFKYKKTALIGAKQETDNTALYLKDNNKPLVLVGNTRIKGNSSLPEQGAKSGNISGISFNGNRFIEGKVGISKQFPKLSFQARSYIQIIQSIYDSDKSLENFKIKTGTKVSNSFENETFVNVSSDAIYLEDVSLIGNLVIQSYSKIVVGNTAKLKDVILIAPKIEIEDNTIGSFQAFATDHILVGNRCELQYPSALVLVKPFTDTFQEEHKIQINIGSILQGNIILLGRKESNNYNPQIVINAEVTVEGEVYCEQALELKGKVYGSVFTDSFITIANGSYYQNHLLNAEINSVELEDEYIGLPLVNTKKGVAKWLY